mgnify:CR=1 FL=1
MARGRSGFFLQKSQADEARELQEQASKAGLFGSVGSLIGSLALTPLLGPGASVAMKALTSGIGSTIGNIAARKIGGAEIDKGGLWFKGQKEQLSKGLDTQAITGGMTSALAAGITPWLKEGMKEPLFSGKGLDVAGAKAARVEKFITPGTEAVGSEVATDAALTKRGTSLLERNPERFLKKTGEAGKSFLPTIDDIHKKVMDSSGEATNLFSSVGSTPSPVTSQVGAISPITSQTGTIADDLMKLWDKQENKSFYG